MNILIGIAILLTLMLSDAPMQNSLTLVETLVDGAFLLFFVLLPPLLAGCQVFHSQCRNIDELENEASSRQFQNHVALHGLVWAGASICMVTLADWPVIVNSTFGLSGFILIDEFIILVPMLVSLITSWWIQAEYMLQGIPAQGKRKARTDFVSLRCRVYLGIVLVPVFLMVLLKDLWPFLDLVSPVLAIFVAIFAMVVLFCCLPWLISLMWTNRSIRDSEGRLELLKLCHSHHLSIKDIRIWDTGNQIVNALVAGILPRFRVLMLSDLLLVSFPHHELKAILRHEAGHVRLSHLPTRIGFVLLPALAMVAVEMDPNQSLEILVNQALSNLELSVDAGILLGIAFIFYVLIVTAWLSKNMEFEADLYAIGAFQSSSEPVLSGAQPNAAQSMADALLRFAQQNPDQYTKRSLTHPSLLDRIDLIKRYSQNPDSAMAFRKRFITLQILIAVAIVIVTFGLIIA